MNCYELFSKVLEGALSAKDEIAELREIIAKDEAVIMSIRNVVESTTYSSDAITVIKKMLEVEKSA